MYKWLKDKYSKYTIRQQVMFDWLKCPKTSKNYKYDFLIEELKVIIEVDGGHHFKDIVFWKSNNDNVIRRDIIKIHCGHQHGYTVVHVPQEYVWFNRNDWESRLIAEIRLHETPETIFVCDDNRYRRHGHIPKKDFICNVSQADVDAVYALLQTL